jgi:hypothetical protein
MDLVEKDTMSTRDIEEKLERINALYRCAYSFCFGFDQTAFVEGARSNGSSF